MARALGLRSGVDSGKETVEVKGGMQSCIRLAYGEVVPLFTIQNQTGGKRVCGRLRGVGAHDKQKGFELCRVGDCDDFQVSYDSHNSQWRSADA